MRDRWLVLVGLRGGVSGMDEGGNVVGVWVGQFYPDLEKFMK